MCLLHETILNLQESLWKQKKKFRKYNNKMYKSDLERRLQYCLRNPQIACKAVHVVMYTVQYPWENLNKIK
jgi:hypothetical protein